MACKKAQRGDADAFVELIEQNKQAMYKVARSYLSCEADIADAMSEAVLSAYEHLGNLNLLRISKPGSPES